MDNFLELNLQIKIFYFNWRNNIFYSCIKYRFVFIDFYEHTTCVKKNLIKQLGHNSWTAMCWYAYDVRYFVQVNKKCANDIRPAKSCPLAGETFWSQEDKMHYKGPYFMSKVDMILHYYVYNSISYGGRQRITCYTHA